MKEVKAYLDIVFKKVTKHHWDNVIALVGDEGTGKSNLALHIVDYWYNKLNGECVKEDIKHMCLTGGEFVADLKDCKKYECTVFDEAGELTNRRAMAKFNVSIMKAYQIIRGDNLFTVLVLPDLFDLDPFFVKRRCKGLFQVVKRGRAKFWSKDRLRRLVARNIDRRVKSYYAVKPTFHCCFPIYKGILKEGYDAKKTAKMQEVRKKLYEEIRDMEKGKPDKWRIKRDDLIVKLADKLGSREAAALAGVSKSRINQIRKQVTSEG